MGVWQLLAVGTVILLGLGGVLVPGVPGQAIVWAAVAWWALDEATGLAWTVLACATGVLLLNQALRPFLPPRRFKAAGVSKRSVLVAGAACVAGFFVLPVVGGIAGFLGGLYGAERVRLGSRGDGWASARTILRAGGYSVMAELYACLLVVGAWLGAVVRG
ncbi:DUF456 domain-containing protein [Streptomyces sp. NPDC006711]|uniref:DUF456 domain-containing protein n=1 Tax=unclassified Streptomyces TaxID=2593676 RepID=UPI0033FD8035